MSELSMSFSKALARSFKLEFGERMIEMYLLEVYIIRIIRFESGKIRFDSNLNFYASNLNY